VVVGGMVIYCGCDIGCEVVWIEVCDTCDECRFEKGEDVEMVEVGSV